MSLEEGAVFAGLSHTALDGPAVELGHGVVVCETYAHLMAPFMVAFSPAEPGKAHPAPWAAASGGFGFDIHVQLFVPGSLSRDLELDPTWAAWWITSLIRLRTDPRVTVPVLASHAFSDASTLGDKVTFRLLEVAPRTLLGAGQAPVPLSDTDLAWVKRQWLSAASLLQKSASFSLLAEAVDQCASARHRNLALLWLWGGLEAVFSPAKAELRYRVSSAIASYLEPSGLGRMALQKRVAKLYDSRSSAAHGRADKSDTSLEETYSLAVTVVTKIIEEDHVPTHAELEARLFGADET